MLFQPFQPLLCSADVINDAPMPYNKLTGSLLQNKPLSKLGCLVKNVTSCESCAIPSLE